MNIEEIRVEVKQIVEKAISEFIEEFRIVHERSLSEIDRLTSELEQKNRELEGCIKLPCEIGETIYEKFYGRTISFSVIGFRKGVMMSEYDDYEEIDCDEWFVEYARDGASCSAPVSDFGKTIFLTKEAALSALEVE